MTPFFLYVHYIDPHAPYEARTAARRPYHNYLTWNDWTNSTNDYDLYLYFGSPLRREKQRFSGGIPESDGGYFLHSSAKWSVPVGWHFYGDDGSYLRGVWTGGVPDDRAISRRLLTR